MNNSKKKILLLFTRSYPYSTATENTFLPQELTELGKHFLEIVLLPTVIEGSRVIIPDINVRVNPDYALFIGSKINRLKYLLITIIDSIFIRELASRSLFFLRFPICFRTMLVHRLVSIMTEKWIRKYFMVCDRKVNDHLIETWWFTETTLGLSNFSFRSKNIITVTRAHGIDLYEERSIHSYIPFRKITLKRLHGIFPDSVAGSSYLINKYPFIEKKVHVGLLGVYDPGFNNKSSKDDTFRMLSCSRLVPLKRIELLILGLIQLGAILKNKVFQWTHIGSGPEGRMLLELAYNSIPQNVHFEFIDYPGKKKLFEFYHDNSIDLFINVSSTEGTPVSIIEAISCGIPILATSVGGNKEIVGHENGILLNENPSPNDIADAIIHLMKNPGKLASMREGSKNRWLKCYNAELNYDTFANIVLNIR